MKLMTKKDTQLGALLWLLSIQYYFTQFVAAISWAKTDSYSWANNTISDLANTNCGPYGARLVCSPLHAEMNASFILLGITTIAGSYLLHRKFPTSRLILIGFSCMALAGLGTILVGLFPENTVSQFHILGAGLSFVLGNVAMLLLGWKLRLPINIRIYTILSGVVGLVALALFMTNTYLGIGIGGMERFVGYPQSIWMTLLGGYLLLHPKLASKKN